MESEKQPPIEPEQRTTIIMEKRPRSIIGPVLLVLVGVLLLLSNLGLFTLNVWELLWKLWPVWLIAIGVEIIFGRRTSWGSWAVLGVVIAVVSGGMAVGGLNFAGSGDMTSTEIHESLNGAQKARVEIHSGVTELQLKDGADGDNLINGHFEELQNERIDKQLSVSGDTAKLTLKSRSRSGFLPFIRTNYDQHPLWDFKLSNKVPMELQVNTGVGKAEIDLSKLQVTQANVDTGVGETTLTVPEKGASKITVHGGIGKITVNIPKGVSYQIRAHNGIGKVDVQGTYENRNGSYVSPNFDSASDKVTLEVDGGIGKIEIQER